VRLPLIVGLVALLGVLWGGPFLAYFGANFDDSGSSSTPISENGDGSNRATVMAATEPPSEPPSRSRPALMSSAVTCLLARGAPACWLGGHLLVDGGPCRVRQVEVLAEEHLAVGSFGCAD